MMEWKNSVPQNPSHCTQCKFSVKTNLKKGEQAAKMSL